MSWQVKMTRKLNRGLIELPSIVQRKLQKLLFDIETHGPVRGNWKTPSTWREFSSLPFETR